ncbi:MAG TPA: hypothetical protein VMD55_05595 [Terracidiphilus sp.]|nr:hypothetical protein [Terracidiphilus sp.]
MKTPPGSGVFYLYQRRIALRTSKSFARVERIDNGVQRNSNSTTSIASC